MENLSRSQEQAVEQPTMKPNNTTESDTTAHRGAIGSGQSPRLTIQVPRRPPDGLSVAKRHLWQLSRWAVDYELLDNYEVDELHRELINICGYAYAGYQAAKEAQAKQDKKGEQNHE